jgi:hypothetical protein
LFYINFTPGGNFFQNHKPDVMSCREIAVPGITQSNDQIHDWLTLVNTPEK